MKRNIEYHRKKAQAFLAGMTLADKVTSFYGSGEELAKIGLVHYDFSGEAAHGVQARHDQSFDLGIPQYTTAFPNPIGMAASFDREMMHRIGEVVGIEMRSLLNEGRHSEGCGYAPTVDMERDPRWGRNEEAYGEDPCLTARMASEYILGMAGDDPDYVRAGATLKHFYGNNNEEERYILRHRQSTLDPLNTELSSKWSSRSLYREAHAVIAKALTFVLPALYFSKICYFD